jgi:hypothetical protein
VTSATWPQMMELLPPARQWVGTSVLPQKPKLESA